ncbi:MAG: selenium-binding protein SBP56-related protein [Planctomycetia bacterium]|nr:selenium-binding protein SBP56-related protein [Planctomycetia bacterium]
MYYQDDKKKKRWTAIIAVCASLVLMMGFSASACAENYRVYFGSCADDGSQGIYASTLNSIICELMPVVKVAEVTDPGYMVFSRDFSRLYVVGEKPESCVYTFHVAVQLAKDSVPELELRKTVSKIGSGACHLSLDLAEKNLLVTNYGSGEIVLLPLDEEGMPGEVFHREKLTGKSVDPKRQNAPHPHSVNIYPGAGGDFVVSDEFFYVPDLGSDKIWIYQMEFQKHAFHAGTVKNVSVPEGSGPRHMVFHTVHPYAYVANELSSTISVFSVEKNGELKALQTISTLPEDFKKTEAENLVSAIRIGPKSEYLYVSNRGHDSITVFQIEENGQLKFVETVPTGGKNPRDFAISPDGECLVVANQESDNVTCFFINKKTGKLNATDKKINIKSPVCVTFNAKNISVESELTIEDSPAQKRRQTYPWAETMRKLGDMSAEDVFTELLHARICVQNMEDLLRVMDLCEAGLEKGMTGDNKKWTEDILFTTTTVWASAVVPRLEAFQEEGNLKRWAPVLDTAQKKLERLLEIRPDSGGTHIFIAKLLQMQENLANQKGKAADSDQNMQTISPKALEHMNRGIELLNKDENKTENASSLGNAYATRAMMYGTQEPEKAFSDLEKANELNPERKFDYLQLRLAILLQKGEFSEAETIVAEMLKEAQAKEDTDTVQEMKKLQILFALEQKDFEQALVKIREELEKAPNHPEFLQMEMRVLLQLNRNEELLNTLNKLLDINALESGLYILRGTTYYSLEQYENALKDFEKAAVLSPGNPETLRLKWDTMIQLGQSDSVIHEIKNLLKMDSKNFTLNIFMVETLLKAKRYEEMMDALTDMETQFSWSDLLEAETPVESSSSPEKKEEGTAAPQGLAAQGTAFYATRAGIYLLAGMHEEAAEDYEKALRLDPNNQMALNNLAWLYVTSPEDKIRNPKRALELAKKACELTDYKEPGFLSTLGAVYAEEGNYEEALKWVEKGMAFPSLNDDLQKTLEKEKESYLQKKPMRERESEINLDFLKEKK